METVKLSQQQSLRIAELPEDYRVVGVHGRAPLVRKPTGQVLCIQQNGRLIAATIAAKRRLAGGSVEEGVRVAGRVLATSPYTSVWG
jgi:hypothetical protein